jgi:hypothetical protein
MPKDNGRTSRIVSDGPFISLSRSGATSTTARPRIDAIVDAYLVGFRVPAVAAAPMPQYSASAASQSSLLAPRDGPVQSKSNTQGAAY